MRRALAVIAALALLACGAPGRNDQPPPKPQPEAECEVPRVPAEAGFNTITLIACSRPLGQRVHMVLDGTVDGQRIPSLEGEAPLPIDVTGVTPFAKVVKYRKGSLATVNMSVYVLRERSTKTVYCKVRDNNQQVPQADSPEVPVTGPNSRAVCILVTSGR